MAAPLGRRMAAAAALGRAGLSPAIAAQARPYRAPPLRFRPGPAPGDPADARAAARRFGRRGEAAAVAARRLWPDAGQLRAAEAEERERERPLREAEAALERREREEARRWEERQQLVARSVAAMPARVSAWRQERARARERAREEAARRQRLLAEAGLGPGGGAPLPPRAGTPPRGDAPRARALLEELERRRRREERRRRREEREEAARDAMAAAEAAAAARPLPPAS